MLIFLILSTVQVTLLQLQQQLLNYETARLWREPPVSGAGRPLVVGMDGQG